MFKFVWYMRKITLPSEYEIIKNINKIKKEQTKWQKKQKKDTEL